ncbi:MAG: hypothetical protein NC938_05595 [Candidatus Omnitrophica bacterium]|nr:hypothetical protein [Candidatus Omnitrophota bacterium]MCM8791151.1 hypothetical protein [Candidatus Omnitrophota bacterium]
MNEIRSTAISMADKICEMLEFVENGFMEHNPRALTIAMEIESEINKMEKASTKRVLELSKSLKSEEDKKELVRLQQTVEMLERMGDEASNLVERIEIKNSEHLLFSDIGVAQFNETFLTMKKSVNMMREFLKGGDSVLRERVIDNGFHVKALVERYRAEHTERLIKGICTPMAANMFFDMLDFTGNLARHSSNIVKLF